MLSLTALAWTTCQWIHICQALLGTKQRAVTAVRLHGSEAEYRLCYFPETSIFLQLVTGLSIQCFKYWNLSYILGGREIHIQVFYPRRRSGKDESGPQTGLCSWFAKQLQWTFGSLQNSALIIK